MAQYGMVSMDYHDKNKDYKTKDHKTKDAEKK